MEKKKKKKYKLNCGYIHNELEYLLLSTRSILNDSNSPYWTRYTVAGVHEEVGYPDTKVESDGGYSKILERIKKISDKIKNEQSKKDLQESCELLREGIDNHNIEKLFKAHEIIHDYDYWVANAPLSLSYPAADWEGIEIYFGKVTIM